MPPNKIIDHNFNSIPTLPVTEPVALQTAKDWLKITFNDDDSLIGDIITYARKAIEFYTSTSLVERSNFIVIAELNFERINKTFIEFEIPYGPIKYTTFGTDIKVEFKNGNKTTDWQTLTLDTDYYYDGIDNPIFKFTCPGIYRFTCKVGFATVPELLIHAMLAEIAFRYEHRGDNPTIETTVLCNTARMKAQPFKRLIWL